MHGFAAALVVLAMLAVPLGLAGTASAADTQTRDLTPVVIGPEPTDRFGGGDVIAVRAGDSTFGVRYGTTEQENNIVIFAEYKRFLGAAEIVDNQGNYLRTRGIPVFTVLGQSLDTFIEFEDKDANGLLNFYAMDNGTLVHNDLPVKALRLNTSWGLTGPTTVVTGNTTYVNFTLTATNVPYSVVWDPLPRHATAADGVLDLVAFTFHLQVDVVNRAGRIPWYRVSVDDGNEQVITHVEFLEWRPYAGRAVQMGAKYDHDIQGWDFVNGTTLLALETHLLFGNFYPSQVTRFVHMAYFHDHAEADDGSYRQDENTTAPAEPRLYTRDRIYFDDDWSRVGRFQWTSNVTVDGRNATMTFQVQGGSRLDLKHGLAEFYGFRIRGAYIYPNGQAIFHDPAMYAESVLPEIPTGFTLTPLTILAIQLGVVGIAMGPALYLRAKARRKR